MPVREREDRKEIRVKSSEQAFGAGQERFPLRHWRQGVERLIHSRLAREAVWSFILKAASAGLGFMTTVVLARLLGAEGYGIYAYAYALITLLAMPAHAGLPNLIVRETARALAEGRPGRVKGAWRWAGRVVALISIGLVGVVGPILVIWQGGWDTPAGQTMAWALLLVPLMALGNLRGAALRGLKQIVAGQLPEFVLRPGFFLLFVGGGAFLWRDGLSASDAMALHVLASLLAFGIGAWLLWRHVPESVRRTTPEIEARGWLWSSTTFALMAGFSVVNNQAGTVILGLFETPDAVGRYRVAVQVAALAAFGLQAINMVVAPRFAELWAKGKKARLQRLVTSSAQVVLGFNVLVTLAFVLVGRPFFEIVFGHEFGGSYGPLLVLLVGQMVNSAAGSVGYLLNMTGHERDTAMGMGVAVVLNLMLNLALVPLLGIMGAAIATAASMALWNALLWWRVWQRLGINSLAFTAKT